MLVAPDGSVTGSVSGGCVEGAVYELATEVAQTGTARLERTESATATLSRSA